MNGLRLFPLGDTITGNPHSVCVSLPTKADVVGYEEKEPRVLAALQTGYPRFLAHPFVARLAAHWRKERGWVGGKLFLCAGEKEATALVAFAGAGQLFPMDSHGIVCVWFDDAEASAAKRGRAFFQHTGVQVSSREAEGILVAAGVVARAFPEERENEASADKIRHELAPLIGVDPVDLRLSRGGMNAFYAAFRAINELAGPSGRRRWVQIGWLYVDTICILSEMSEGGAAPIVWNDVEDLAGLAERLRPVAHEIAGIVVEAPTNPLFGMPDLAAMRALADSIGAFLVIDPSLVSVWNARVLPYADVMVASQTKYAAASGDVLAGLLAINSDQPRAAELSRRVDQWITALAEPDLQRMAADLRRNRGLVEQVNGTLHQVVPFLEAHPRVKQVWWTCKGKHPRWLCGPGAVVSFALKDGVEDFYDRLQMAKGPSFGTAYSLLSPYVWLAHYDLVKSPHGKEVLARAGVPPDLMRLSVGTEPPAAIIAALKEALEG